MVRTLEISDETYEKIKLQLQEEEKLDISSLDDLVGKSWLFRTVTYHILGKVEQKIGKWLKIKNASWVADSGRFMNFIKNGVQSNSEIEPVGDMFLNLESVTDFFFWKHSLPKEQK